MAGKKSRPDAGALRLCSPAAMSVAAATARHSALGQSAASTEVAIYSARLNLLRAALHSAAQAVLVATASGSAGAVPTNAVVPSGERLQLSNWVFSLQQHSVWPSGAAGGPRACPEYCGCPGKE